MIRETHLTDPRALRAYAHPTRMKLVGMLRSRGPFTATKAAELTGESVASCSYHLRMLAKYGLVEEAEGGRGREKPWRATAQYTSWPDYSEDPATAEAATRLNTAVAEVLFGHLTRAIEQHEQLPPEWQEAEDLGDNGLYLTPAELTELRDRMRELLTAYDDRLQDPSLRPEGARLVYVVRAAFVHPDQPEKS
jgi:DNA-binding transcriptional ArsR family regulator